MAVQVCGKQTGHAEVVAITYDPSVITFKDLLDVFFTVSHVANNVLLLQAILLKSNAVWTVEGQLSLASHIVSVTFDGAPQADGSCVQGARLGCPWLS